MDFLNDTPSPGFIKNIEHTTCVKPDQFDEFLRCNLTKGQYMEQARLFKKSFL